MKVYKNTVVVRCDPDHSVIMDAAVVVGDGRFAWVGRMDDLEVPEGAQVYDAGGAILMPGLINMHAHCGDTLFRGLVEDLPLEAWLQTVWKAEAAVLADADNSQLGVELGIAELIMGGVTSVMDMFWHADRGYMAAAKAGVRWASGGIFFDGPGMDGLGPETRLDAARRLFDQGHEFVGVLPHGTYTVAPDTISAALKLAEENNGFFCTHAAETRAEQDDIQLRYGMSVIRLLASLGALGPHCVLAHCVHVDAGEIEILAKSGTHVVHNPMSNLKLASGFAPVPEMLAAGVNMTLGTDGPISGNDMDMFLAMRLAATIHKAASGDAAAVSAGQALHMATLNGAKALGAAGRLGSIEVGKQADFILVDTSGPHASPMFNPINHLVYSASKSDVRDVYVGGKQIMRDRQVLTLDIADLTSRTRSLQPKILASLETT